MICCYWRLWNSVIALLQKLPNAALTNLKYDVLRLLLLTLPHSNLFSFFFGISPFWKMKMLKLRGSQAALVSHTARWNAAEPDWAGLSLNNRWKVFTLPWRRTLIGFLPAEQREADTALWEGWRKKWLWSTLINWKEPKRRGPHRRNPHMQDTDLPFFWRKKKPRLWPRWKQIWARATNEKSWIPC